MNSLKKIESYNDIPAILKKADRVLFLIHLAIGDFAYLQSAFKALKKAYPDLRIDLFVIESRCTNDCSKWPLLEKDVIYDWLENCGLFQKVYRKNYAPHLFQESIKDAYEEDYPLIISFGDVHSEPTELYARQMANTNTIVVGLKLHINWYRFKYHISKRKLWKNLDLTFSSIKMKKGRHISELFAHWFSQIGNIHISPEDRLPYIDIPTKWLEKAQEQLSIMEAAPQQSIVFINYLAKDPNRSWNLSQAISLIQEMQKLNHWHNALYILNATPDLFVEVKEALHQQNVHNATPFSAIDSFYELPAILQLSTLIISVETSIMHLANAVNTPLIALMRNKTPEWAPLKQNITEIIWCTKQKDKIKDISVSTVIDRIKMLPQHYQS